MLFSAVSSVVQIRYMNLQQSVCTILAWKLEQGFYCDHGLSWSLVGTRETAALEFQNCPCTSEVWFPPKEQVLLGKTHPLLVLLGTDTLVPHLTDQILCAMHDRIYTAS